MSVNPPVFLAKGFLSPSEADAFVEHAKEKGGWQESGFLETDGTAPHTKLLESYEEVINLLRRDFDLDQDAVLDATELDQFSMNLFRVADYDLNELKVTTADVHI